MMCTLQSSNSDAFKMFDRINNNGRFLVFIVYAGMMCQAKTSYIETEIEWGARFEPCMTLEKGSFRVDLRRFHTTYQVPLPNCSASQVHQILALADCKLQDSKPSRACGTWAEGDKDKQLPHGGFTIDNILEERVSEGNESEGSTENSG